MLIIAIKDNGINIIIMKSWIMVVVLTNPIYTQLGKYVYISPMAFIGYVIKPVFKDIWPQSAGLNKEVYDKSVVDILVSSSAYVS